MKLIVSLFFALAFYCASLAQMNQISGVYKGRLVNDTTEITITLDLKKDSTYAVSLEFGIYPNHFPTNLTDTCKAEGVWRAQKNIIFFLPDQSKSTSNHNLEQAWYWFGSINALNQGYCGISVSIKEYNS